RGRADQNILTWARLLKLPIHYFNELAITRISNHIGRTVRLDLATAEGARARYARVCVEIDISKPLLGKYMIEDRMFFMEYESLENICFGCGFYEHKQDGCSPQTQDKSESQEKEAASQTPPATEGDAGCWMTVQRRHKGKKVVPVPAPKQQEKSGSRFLSLQVDEEVLAPTDPLPDALANVKVVDPVIAAHATKLSKILNNASHSVLIEIPHEAMDAQLTPQSEPLADVTNTSKPKKAGRPPGSKNKASGLISGDELISVPVTYNNPIFQGTSRTSQAVKANPAGPRKGKVGNSARSQLSSPIPGKKEGKPIRSFTSQLKKDVPKTKGGEKLGDPPDQAQS
ncbi:hypothetical protein LINPERHAP1_LOCUS6323, partial [Linum perenne]